MHRPSTAELDQQFDAELARVVAAGSKMSALVGLHPDSDPLACQCLRSQLTRFARGVYRMILDEAAFCAGGPGSKRLWKNQRCFPVDVGKDPRSGVRVTVSFTCGDVCPENAELFLAYDGLDAKQCEKVGGSPWFDIFEYYIGCVAARIGDCD
jgi:hypothetical protein